MNTEPSAIIGTITGLAAAILTALIAFGVNLDQTQHDALLGLVAVAAPIIAGIVIRGKVWAPESHDDEVNNAYERGKASAQSAPPARRNVKPQEGIARYTNVGR